MQRGMFYPKRVPKFIDALFPQCLWRKADDALYLTFDDSPSPYTLELLDLLAQHNAKATFFLIGKQIERYPDYAEAIVQQGHRIGNHSYSHTRNLQSPFFRDEVIQTAQLIAMLNPPEVARPSLFRFPFGRFNFASLRILSELNIQPIMWSLLTADFDASVSDKMVLNLLRSAIAGDIVVMHDNEKSIKKLRAVLPIALGELSRRFSFNLL
ncbi:MAG: polysaccharide deacetylase family protein [Chloroherpetonaceae bacterium]